MGKFPLLQYKTALKRPACQCVCVFSPFTLALSPLCFLWPERLARLSPHWDVTSGQMQEHLWLYAHRGAAEATGVTTPPSLSWTALGRKPASCTARRATLVVRLMERLQLLMANFRKHARTHTHMLTHKVSPCHRKLVAEALWFGQETPFIVLLR